MTNPAIRRSSRETWANYASFGRDYLATELGWSRPKFDDWLLSRTVHPHLVFFHSTCIERTNRLNEGIEWINTGYFEGDCNLEEDVLLLCLGEGNDGSEEDASGIKCKKYAEKTARTFKWTTVELWARSVWRIVQDNCGKGAIFERAVKFHPAAAYGIVFDLLGIAFHNIAHVGSESVWATIINSASIPTVALTPNTKSTSLVAGSVITRQIALDRDPDTLSEDDTEQEEEILDDDGIGIETDDSDFSSASSEEDSEDMFLETPKKDRGAGRRATPTAPTKASGGSKRVREQGDVEESPSKKVKQWIKALPPKAASMQDPDGTLKMFDEDGLPITGYRSASTVLPPSLQQQPMGKPLVVDEDPSLLRRDSGVWLLGPNVDTEDVSGE